MLLCRGFLPTSKTRFGTVSYRKAVIAAVIAVIASTVTDDLRLCRIVRENPPVARRRTLLGLPVLRARKTKRLELPELSRSHCTLVTAVRKSQRTAAKTKRIGNSQHCLSISPLKARYQLITHTFHSYSPVDTARLSSISASPLDDRYYRKGGQIYIYTSPLRARYCTAGRTYLPKIDILREVGLSTLAK